MKNKTLKTKLLAMMIAAATTVGTVGMPITAIAADNVDVYTVKIPSAEATPITGVKAIAAHKAAVTAGEILGAEIATADASSLSEAGEQIFGTDYNLVPSAYLSNYLFEQAGNDLSDDAKVTQIVSNSYGPNFAEGSMVDDVVNSISLATRADILLGTAENTSGFVYEDALPISGYTPSLVSYAVPKLSSQDNHYDATSSTDLANSMTGLMYKLADEMGTTGRYSSQAGGSVTPADIASTYEHYVKDLQLYILSEIATNNNVNKKTVAIVGTNSQDATKLDIYKFVPSNGQTTSRPAEYLKYTTTNVLDTTACSSLTVSDKGVATIDASSASTYLSGANYVIAMKPTSSSVIINDTARAALATAGFTADNGKLLETSPTTAYGCYMNSVDNALGMAVLNSQVYPEVLPRNEVVAYFYSKLYHVNSDCIDALTSEHFATLLNNSTTLAGDEPITDRNVSYLISNCESKMGTGYSYFTEHADSLITACPDISYVLPPTDTEE